MSDLDTSALRNLLTGPLSVLPIGSTVETNAERGGHLADSEWIAIGGADGGYWWDIVNSDEADDIEPSARLTEAGARLTRVSVDVATFRALLDAAAERDRLRAALEAARTAMHSAESGWEDDPRGAIHRARLDVELALKPGDPIVEAAITRADELKAEADA